MRKAKPFLAVMAFECLTKNSGKTPRTTSKRLMQYFIDTRHFSTGTAFEAIKNLEEDGIIIVNEDNSKGRSPKQHYRIFDVHEVEDFETDCYCFECYLPGELMKCDRCTRVFHMECIRRNPERPNYVIQPANEIAQYEDESDVEVQRNSVMPHSIERNNSISSNSIPKVGNLASHNCKPVRVRLKKIKNASNMERPEADIENKFDVENKLEIPDVICMGEVRPPTRQRANASITPNTLKNEDDSSENIIQLCTCCKIMEKGQLMQPPNLSIDEMHHLLSYGFKRADAWIKCDINKDLKMRISSEKYISLLIKKLFKRKLVTLGTIKKKIQDKKYKLLVEILIDFLEFQFAIGVLFGRHSLKFDCSKYAMRDLSYDIKELKRCPDCFRHCNDRLTPFWFALPCRQRHELVFAKCQGHSYWPAKVVRVLKNAQLYDVRFFGGNHERSVISSSNIRPIDTLSIDFPKLQSFKKAMDELQCYQTLDIQTSPSTFSYNVSQNDVKRIVENIMGVFNVDYKEPSILLKRRKTLNKNTPKTPLFSVSSISESDADSEACSSTSAIRQSKQITAKKRRTSQPRRLCNDNSPASPALTSTPLPPPTNVIITIEQHIAEMDALRKQLYELHQRELAIAKLKSYCAKCLEPSQLLCCLHASYCSRVCQRQHWLEGHAKNCANMGILNNV